MRQIQRIFVLLRAHQIFIFFSSFERVPKVAGNVSDSATFSFEFIVEQRM
jgi:hypothetical protein